MVLSNAEAWTQLQTAVFCNFYADFEGNSEELFYLKNVINGPKSTSVILITKKHDQFHKHIYISSRLYVVIHRLSQSFTLFTLHIFPPEPLLTAILYIVVSISTRVSDAKEVINDHLKLLNTAVRNLSQVQMRFSSRDNLKVTL